MTMRGRLSLWRMRGGSARLFDHERGDGERRKLDGELFVPDRDSRNILVPILSLVHGAAGADDLRGGGGDLLECGEIERHGAFARGAVHGHDHDPAGFAVVRGERGGRRGDDSVAGADVAGELSERVVSLSEEEFFLDMVADTGSPVNALEGSVVALRVVEIGTVAVDDEPDDPGGRHHAVHVCDDARCEPERASHVAGGLAAERSGAVDFAHPEVFLLFFGERLEFCAAAASVGVGVNAVRNLFRLGGEGLEGVDGEVDGGFVGDCEEDAVADIAAAERLVELDDDAALDLVVPDVAPFLLVAVCSPDVG